MTRTHLAAAGLTTSATDIHSLIAENARNYDLLPYISRPFAQTRPAHLAALAQLFGLQPPAVAQARVLELGAAAGGNLIPLAARHPQAQFLGVDLSGVQVAQGQARIASLGLDNIRLALRNLTDIGSADGEFDYIICHGVYSWVPPPVREAIFRICQDHLSPRGLAVVSYNVLPGWRLPQVMRDAFMSAMPDGGPPLDRTVRARELARLIADHCCGTPAYKQTSRDWAQRIGHFADDYLGHEFLEPSNDPCTFSSFMALAHAHGLSFLAEAELHTMVLDNLAAETAAKVRELTGNELLPTEQLLDVLTGRTFRHTVLVRSAQEAHIRRQLSPQSVARLHLTPRTDLAVNKLAHGGHIGGSGQLSLQTTDDAVVALAQKMVQRLPASCCAQDLAGAGAKQADIHLAQDLMFRMALRGLGSLSSEPVHANSRVQARPEVDRLARLDAARGADFTANLRHEHAPLDALAQLVLPLLDGSRDTPALLEDVARSVRSGRLNFALNGQSVTDPDEQVRLACDATLRMVSALGARALLV